MPPMTADVALEFQVILAGRRSALQATKSSIALDPWYPEQWSCKWWRILLGVFLLLAGASEAGFGHLFLVFGAHGLALFGGELAVLVFVIFFEDLFPHILLLLGQWGATPRFRFFVRIRGVGGQRQGAAESHRKNQCTQHISPFSGCFCFLIGRGRPLPDAPGPRVVTLPLSGALCPGVCAGGRRRWNSPRGSPARNRSFASIRGSGRAARRLFQTRGYWRRATFPPRVRGWFR